MCSYAERENNLAHTLCIKKTKQKQQRLYSNFYIYKPKCGFLRAKTNDHTKATISGLIKKKEKKEKNKAAT